MARIRFNTLETIFDRKPIDVQIPAEKISKYFATNVFTHETMREYLSEDVFDELMLVIKSGTKIDREIADHVASAMKAWALNKGATHFTHWFQPLTGLTAEKHDSFFIPVEGGKGIENFNGDSLVQQEPDASSFPSGGLRNTFEARGYTAWDPSSPAFIIEIGSGKTLCIPTIYIAYTGEALDYKAPLLKSNKALEDAAVKICRYFDKRVNKVFPTLGWEQEYFLIDESLYYSRPDLVMTGRTVFGRPPIKGQQLSDHYFGVIPERIYRYMIDLETEALKLGIPLRTRHNEVAPSQFECAPYFEDANLAVDHNQLIMILMDRVARKHDLVVLFHEKPFAGVNGSGKHNNWSLMTDTGVNLLSPGKTPKTSLQFLTFLVNTVMAVSRHGDLLRASIASAGNDFRLGANEAPPAIFSVFIGSHLTKLLNAVEARVSPGKFSEQDKAILKLDIHNMIPDVFLDNTDRNRTSPFAFTGNKFEVRAVGSSANCAASMTVLNTIVADQLKEFKKEVDQLINKGEKKDSAILQVLRKYISGSKKILFEGDGYSIEWEREAEKRGLSNFKTTPPALQRLIAKETVELFGRNDVYTERELQAHNIIQLDNYAEKVKIEARIIEDLATNYVIPVSIKYQNELIKNIKGLKKIGLNNDAGQTQQELVIKISDALNVIRLQLAKLNLAIEGADSEKTPSGKAESYAANVRPLFDEIRASVDDLELIVDDKEWPLPKYRELLFIR